MVFKLSISQLGIDTLGGERIILPSIPLSSAPPTHDFKAFPELTNRQLEEYMQSPHKQITEDFRALVVKVHDGDTITLRWDERDFDFPLRFLGTDAPEMNEGGAEARDYVKDQIEGDEVEIKIDPKQRVGKYGRLLGRVITRGMDLGNMMIQLGYATTFEARNESKLPNINKELNISKWI